MKFLTAYQNAAYAARYRALVDEVKAAEAARAPGKCELTEAVARYLFKLMAYKDEYEVARLYTDGAFLKQVETEFDGDNLRFEFHLAPPLLARRDKTTGLPRKMSFGPWILPVFRLLAKFKGLARHAVRSVRTFAGTAHRAQADRRLRGDARRGVGESDAGQSSPRGRRWLRSRKKSAVSATSSSSISPPPRPTKRRCSSNSAPARRCC